MLCRQGVLTLIPRVRSFHALPQSKSFKFSPEVKDALAQNKPVVALESTIISHGTHKTNKSVHRVPNCETGMPYPQNVATAQSVEAIVRDRGAIPATIAILDGQVNIGMYASVTSTRHSGGLVFRIGSQAP